MIQGVGTDIIEIGRIQKSIDEYGSKFLDRLFTSQEQDYCHKHRESARQFAGRFAAKEAISKALGTGICEHLGWLDIEILNDENGKPLVHLSEHAKMTFGVLTIHITISHCKEYAVAFAISENLQR